MPVESSPAPPATHGAFSGEPSQTSTTGSPIRCPPDIGLFRFAVLSALRSAQLLRGCRPRVDGVHKVIVTAQREVSEGKVRQMVPQALPEDAGAPGAGREAPSRDRPSAIAAEADSPSGPEV
jgi:hypothetical protein